MLKTVCATCGTAYEPSNSAQCPTCRPKDDGSLDKYVRGNRHERGYGNAWDRLSKRARKRQPFCSDCGRTDHLTADHSVEAWRRHERGLPIRLKDIDVVCQWCNADRGAARGDGATDEHRGQAVEVVAEWIEASD